MPGSQQKDENISRLAGNPCKFIYLAPRQSCKKPEQKIAIANQKAIENIPIRKEDYYATLWQNELILFELLGSLLLQIQESYVDLIS